jgi:transposase-like protein
MSDVNCPYCDAEQEINHDDGYGYEESKTHEQECDSCGKHFAYTTEISFDYNVAKADCMNDGEHIWKPTTTVPREWTQMECTMCNELREPTIEEKTQYSIPPKEKYIQ